MKQPTLDDLNRAMGYLIRMRDTGVSLEVLGKEEGVSRNVIWGRIKRLKEFVDRGTRVRMEQLPFALDEPEPTA